MSLEQDIEFFNKIPTFHILGREALRIVAISAEPIHLQTGELLFEEGEPADGGYMVQAGAVVLSSTRDKVRSDSVVASPGTLIGETALIVDTIRPATAIAAQPSTLLRIPRGVFLRVLEGEPGAAEALRRVIAKRLDAAINELDLIAPNFANAGGLRGPDLR